MTKQNATRQGPQMPQSNLEGSICQLHSTHAAPKLSSGPQTLQPLLTLLHALARLNKLRGRRLSSTTHLQAVPEAARRLLGCSWSGLWPTAGARPDVGPPVRHTAPAPAPAAAPAPNFQTGPRSLKGEQKKASEARTPDAVRALVSAWSSVLLRRKSAERQPSALPQLPGCRRTARAQRHSRRC